MIPYYGADTFYPSEDRHGNFMSGFDDGGLGGGGEQKHAAAAARTCMLPQSSEACVFVCVSGCVWGPCVCVCVCVLGPGSSSVSVNSASSTGYGSTTGSAIVSGPPPCRAGQGSGVRGLG